MRSEAKQNALRTISSSLYRQLVVVFVNKAFLKYAIWAHCIQGTIHDFKNLKQEFEQTKIFKLNKYIIKMAY